MRLSIPSPCYEDWSAMTLTEFWRGVWKAVSIELSRGWSLTVWMILTALQVPLAVAQNGEAVRLQQRVTLQAQFQTNSTEYHFPVQDRIESVVLDRITNVGIPFASVQLFDTSGSFICEAKTDIDGCFLLCFPSDNTVGGELWVSAPEYVKSIYHFSRGVVFSKAFSLSKPQKIDIICSFPVHFPWYKRIWRRAFGWRPKVS